MVTLRSARSAFHVVWPAHQPVFARLAGSCAQGTTNSTFFVVKDGTVQEVGGRKYVAGDFFEEATLHHDSKVEHDVVAVEHADLFQITRPAFEAALKAVRMHRVAAHCAVCCVRVYLRVTVARDGRFTPTALC